MPHPDDLRRWRGCAFGILFSAALWLGGALITFTFWRLAQ